MDIKNLAELDKIILLCRKRGVNCLEIDGIKIELASEAPPSSYKKKQQTHGSDLIEGSDVYDEEAALFWSSAGIPDEKAAQ